MDETTTTAPAVTTTPADAGAKTEVAAPSHGDWNAMAKNTRETKAELAEVKSELKSVTASLAKLVGAGQTPTTPVVKASGANASEALSAELAELRASQSLNDALNDMETSLTRDQREMVRTLFKAESPSDVGPWLEKKVGAFGTGKPVATAAVTTPIVVKPVGAGPPAGANTAELPLDPAALPQSVVDAMTPEEAKAYMDRVFARSNTFVNPFTKARALEDATNDTAEAGRQIAEVLSRVSKRR